MMDVDVDRVLAHLGTRIAREALDAAAKDAYIDQLHAEIEALRTATDGTGSPPE